MELLIVAGALCALALLAMRYGVDSRDPDGAGAFHTWRESASVRGEPWQTFLVAGTAG